MKVVSLEKECGLASVADDNIEEFVPVLPERVI
jgi:hypothetical protein